MSEHPSKGIPYDRLLRGVAIILFFSVINLIAINATITPCCSSVRVLNKFCGSCINLK